MSQINSPCPLSIQHPSLIPETDHKLNRCLCKFCSCGLHTCSYYQNIKTYPNTTFQSTYQKSFKTSAPFPVVKARSPVSPKKKSGIPLKSSHKIDFKPFKVEVFKSKSIDLSEEKAKFSGSSCYRSSFPDWQFPKVPYESRYQPPLRSTEIPFRGSSIYQSSFMKSCLNSCPTQLRDSDTGSPILNPGTDLDRFQSSYQVTMKDFSDSPVVKCLKTSQIKQEIFLKTSGDYSTTAKSSYQSPSAKSKLT